MRRLTSITEITLLDLHARHMCEERVVIERAIEAEGGMLRRAAERLGIGESHLRKLLARHDGIAEHAAELRAASGYVRGRPKG